MAGRFAFVACGFSCERFLPDLGGGFGSGDEFGAVAPAASDPLQRMAGCFRFGVGAGGCGSMAGRGVTCSRFLREELAA